VLPFLRVYCIHLLCSVKMLFLFLYIGREFKVNKIAKKKIKYKSFLKTFFGFSEGH
jgi:hypothetical protein